MNLPAGRAWKLPADIDTDALAPGKAMSGGLDAMAPHCLATVRAAFASNVQSGDFIVAGPRFGIGSSREQAAAVLKHLGIRAVLAPSFAGLFYRNAINLGLTALVCPLAESIPDAARLTLDFKRNQVVATLTPDSSPKGQTASTLTNWPFEPIPDFLQAMLDAGGLIPQLRQRLAAERQAGS